MSVYAVVMVCLFGLLIVYLMVEPSLTKFWRKKKENGKQME
jgi:hypothetical protein